MKYTLNNIIIQSFKFKILKIFSPINNLDIQWTIIIDHARTIYITFYTSSFFNEWVRNISLTTDVILLRYIKARTSYIRWNENDDRFVIDRHAELGLYGASSLHNSQRVDMLFNSNILSWFRATSLFSLSL